MGYKPVNHEKSLGNADIHMRIPLCSECDVLDRGGITWVCTNGGADDPKAAEPLLKTFPYNLFLIRGALVDHPMRGLPIIINSN